MSPQIVTETLYSLSVVEEEAFIPTEIHLITTKAGASEAKLQLLHPKTGMFHALCRDYQFSNIQFNEQNIYIIEDQEGNKLEDIKTPRQNEAAADFITDIVSRLTQDNDAALHVSIAGGRKTMGYYLGYALSLYGRAQDRLSHVLVSDRYEGLKDFFYPTPESHVIYDRNDKALDTKEAEVMLAQIPFVRLRDGLPEHLLQGKTGFSESVRFARQMESAPCLNINRQQRTLIVNGAEIKLSDVNYVFYNWILGRSLEGETTLRTEGNDLYVKEYMVLYEEILGEMKDKDRINKVLGDEMPSDWMSERKSAIQKAFIKVLGKPGAQAYTVQSTGRNTKLNYFIGLSEEQVIIQ
jgi:CRISPR-associated protein (TIGR02584 family)